MPCVYVHSAVCKTYWVYWCSINLWSIGGWSICHGYMCILLHVELLGFNNVAWIYGQFGSPSAMELCAFCYTWKLLGVTILHGSMLNLGVHLPWVYVHSVIYETYWVKHFCMDLWSIWRVQLPWVYVQSAIHKMYWVYWCSINLWSIGGWSFCQGYMCILLYMKLLGFNSVAWIYGQFGGLGPSIMGIYVFCYTWNLLGVTVLHGSMLNLGVHQPWVYVHSAICEMHWMDWCRINLWSIGGLSKCHRYMSILIYMKLLWFNSVAWIYGQFGGVDPSAMGICAFCYVWDLWGVTV